MSRNRRSKKQAEPGCSRHRRVEMVLPTLGLGGMEVMASGLAQGLARRGYEVGITCIEEIGELGEELSAAGLRVTTVRLPGWRTNFSPTLLTSWFRHLRPDIVHVHSGAWLKGAKAARRAQVPAVVHTIHGLGGLEPLYVLPLLRWAARYTDRIVAVSDPLRSYVVRVLRLRKRIIDVVPNGVDVSVFHRDGDKHGLRRALGISDDATLIGYIGRFAPIKNPLLLIEAFTLISERFPRAYLVLIGAGPMREAIDAHVVARGLRSRIRLLERVSDPAPVYRELDIFALASDTEGTSMSVLEAMASGVCVVATAVGGTPKLLDHGRVGALVRPADAADLAEAMASLLANPHQRSQYAAAARDHVVANYSDGAMLDAYEAIYHMAHRHSHDRQEASCVA